MKNKKYSIIFSHLFVYVTFLSTLVSFASAPQVTSYFEVHGHRGARAWRPENTLSAFQLALSVGADVLELDLGVSRDGVLVINHDFSVNTDLCSSNEVSLSKLKFPRIHDLTLREIKTYDCGSKLNIEFKKTQALVPGEKIPTLVELIRFVKSSNLPKAKTVKLNIETKIEEALPQETVDPKTFVQLIVETLKLEQVPAERVLLQSFDFRTLLLSKRYLPELKTSALVDVDATKKLNVDDVFARSRADYISPNGNLVTKKVVERSHQLGKKVLPWTINSKMAWKHFIGMGVDGIITDDPWGLLHLIIRK